VRRRGIMIAAPIAMLIAAAVSAARGGFASPTPKEGWQAWSDGFFAAAVFVGGAGALAFASSDGLFDAMRFSIGKAVSIVRSKEKRDLYPKTFYDYRMMRSGRGAGGAAALLVGLVCLALAGAFLALCMRA